MSCIFNVLGVIFDLSKYNEVFDLKLAKMKTIETLNSTKQVNKKEAEGLWVSDCKAHVWFKDGLFCAQKDGIHIIRRKTFNAIWNYLYTR